MVFCWTNRLNLIIKGLGKHWADILEGMGCWSAVDSKGEGRAGDRERGGGDAIAVIAGQAEVRR